MIICRRYYDEHDAPSSTLSAFVFTAFEIPERLCKVESIQGELVVTKTWLKIGENICGKYFLNLNAYIYRYRKLTSYPRPHTCHSLRNPRRQKRSKIRSNPRNNRPNPIRSLDPHRRLLQ